MKNEPIAVGILEGNPIHVPVGIVRRHRLIAMGQHAINACLPSFSFGDVKDEKVLGTITAWSRHAALRDQLQISFGSGKANHATGKPGMIKRAEKCKPGSIATKAKQSGEVRS